MFSEYFYEEKKSFQTSYDRIAKIHEKYQRIKKALGEKGPGGGLDPGLNLVSDSFPTDLKRIADNVHYKGKRVDTEPKTSAGNDLKVNGAGIGDRRKKLREQAFGSNFVGKRAKEMEVSFSRFI